MAAARYSKFLLFFFLLIGGQAWAQAGLTGKKANVDSLERELAKAKEDTGKVNLLNRLAMEYKLHDPAKGIKTAEEALKLAEQLGFSQGRMAALNQLGIIYKTKGDYEKALGYYNEGLEIGKKSGNLKLAAKISANMGNIYVNQGNFPKGLEYFLEALDFFEKVNDDKSIGASLSNIGVVYSRMGKTSEAIHYYKRALVYREKVDDRYGIANDLGNLAIEYSFIAEKSQKRSDYDTCMKYYQLSLDMLEEFGDKQGIAGTLDNMAQPLIELAVLSGKKSEFDHAEEIIRKALGINLEIDDKVGISACYSNLATLYGKQHMPDKSIDYNLKALEIARSIGQKEWVRDNYHGLAASYLEKKDYKTALDYFTKYADVKDSILNETGTKQIAEMQARYETEKKQREIESLEQQKNIKELEAAKQRMIKNFVTAGMVLVLILALLLYNRYLVKKKANEQLSQQNAVIEEKNTTLQTAYSIIEEKNKNITDSINYAKRIQEALLPAKELKYRLFPEAFVLFQPRDIVSGDFYWFAEKNGKKLIAAVDCTGHGVPGAFMSMIGNAFLNEIVLEKGITTPSKILDELRILIISSLKQNDGENKDGMDIALCSFHEDGSSLEYAGANNPLWIMRKGKAGVENMEEIKADKQPIGLSEGENVPFTNHALHLNKGDSLYIFSDGYADQFGGDKGKKFKYKNLQKLIASIQDKPMSSQEHTLLDALNRWKGNLEQVDDILVIGVRV